MTLVLRVPYPTPSLNDFANVRARWRYGNIRKQWERRIVDAWVEQRVTAGRMTIWELPPGRRVRLTIERITKSGQLDVDNFVGGLKPVIDALKLMRFIVDDSPQWLDLQAVQTLRPDITTFPTRWTQITLERDG